MQNPTGGKLYFSAYSPGYGHELWSYDGDTAIRLTDLAPGSKDGLPNNSAAPAVFNGLVYFSGSTDSLNYRLYAYNPASGQANLVDTIHTGGRKIADNYAGMIVYNNALYFGAYDSATGCELWKYDGATAGMVADIYPGPQSGMDIDNIYRLNQGFIEYNGHLYFRARTPANGAELWRIGNLPSGIQSISWDGEAAVRPNPAAASAILDITLKSTQQLRVSLTDVQGKEVFTSGMLSFTAGTHAIHIPVQALAGGQYFYRLSGSGGRQLASGSIVHP